MSWFLDQELICGDHLLAVLCCVDLLPCSLQTLISQSHACVCQGEKAAAPPAVSMCDCASFAVAPERFCSVLRSSDLLSTRL